MISSDLCVTSASTLSEDSRVMSSICFLAVSRSSSVICLSFSSFSRLLLASRLMLRILTLVLLAGLLGLLNEMLADAPRSAGGCSGG